MSPTRVRIMARETLKHQAYEKIKRMIVSNQVSPDRPVTEIELSKLLGMGRGPIRESLNLLSKDGLIQLIPNKGGILRKFSSHDLIQIYQIREALDPMAAKQAAGRIPLAELEKIEKKYVLQEDTGGEPDRQLSKELHSLIYRSCGNPYLVEIFENLQLKDEVSWNSLWNLWTQTSDAEVVKKRKREHVQIIQALKQRDAESAERISKEHISNAIHDLLKMIVT